MKLLIFFSFLLLFFQNILAQSNVELEKIYQSILKATFTKDKIEVAKKFLHTEECKQGKWTLKLLKDSHYWNREAGIYLVEECKNSKLDKDIIQLLLEDHMTRYSVRKLIQKEPDRFSKLLLAAYKKDLWEPTKEDLFSMYEITKDEDISNFLQRLIRDTHSKDRSLAFKTLMKHSKKPDDSFFRSYLDDNELGKYSLEYILEKGKSKDLELFQGILENPNSKIEHIAIACLAVNKWGSEKEKKTTYLRFLKDEDQKLLPSAISIFGGLMDDEIFAEVSKLSRTGKTQSIRAEAVVQLKNSSDIKRIPYIILFLQEDYQTQRKHHVGDAIASVITLGIHGIFQGIQENKRRVRFNSLQSELIAYLQKETGENITDKKKWKEWAKEKKYLPISISFD